MLSCKTKMRKRRKEEEEGVGEREKRKREKKTKWPVPTACLGQVADSSSTTARLCPTSGLTLGDCHSLC